MEWGLVSRIATESNVIENEKRRGTSSAGSWKENDSMPSIGNESNDSNYSNDNTDSNDSNDSIDHSQKLCRDSPTFSSTLSRMYMCMNCLVIYHWL